jgi:AcrR family transcriptional regulator
VPRWEPDAVGRLQAAAIDLFAEQGYEQTTVAEITDRAGLTKRSFFNHFSDKREALFGPISELQREIATQGIARCADTIPPLEAVVRGLNAADDELFAQRRAESARRQKIIEANPELQERELSKLASLTDAIAVALRNRGVDPDDAVLTAQAGVLVHETAMRRWTQSAEQRALGEFLSDALLSLRAVVG